MNFLLTIIKSLPVILSVLVLHVLVLTQVIQHAAEKNRVLPPKPLMVSLIIPKPAPPPIKPIPPPIKPAPLPVQRVVKKTSKKRVKQQKKVKIAKSKKRKRIKKVKRKKRKKVNKKKRRSQSTKSAKKSAKKIAKKSYSKSSKRRKVATLPKSSSSRKKVRSKPKSSSSKKKVRTNRALSRVVKQSAKKTATSSKAPHRRQSRKQSVPKKATKKKSRTSKTTKPSYRAAYLHNPRPPYPRMSKRRGEEGTVLLRVKVNKNGRAASVQIRKSSGSKRLDNAARKTVSKWRFVPAKKDGKPVNGWVIVPIAFKLK